MLHTETLYNDFDYKIQFKTMIVTWDKRALEIQLRRVHFKAATGEPEGWKAYWLSNLQLVSGLYHHQTILLEKVCAENCSHMPIA